MAAPGAASSVNTLAGGHEARRLSATGGGSPFGGEGMAQMHRLGQRISRQVRMLVGLPLNQACPHRRRMAADR